MMILFLDSCSCMRMTFSVPCIHQAGFHFRVADRAATGFTWTFATSCLQERDIDSFKWRPEVRLKPAA